LLNFPSREYTLCCFGGAGGQHACGVADALGMKTVFIHPLAGVLSAYGMGLAAVRILKERAVEAPVSEALLQALQPVLAMLETEGREELKRQIDAGGDGEQGVQIVRKLHLLY
jgi:5-oxoprolinase (ATP-hydrolysing)